MLVGVNDLDAIDVFFQLSVRITHSSESALD
jgi:hypothetical protein